MPVGDICVRDVVTGSRSTTIHEAAQLMRQHHVGDLLIVDESAGKRIPIGIITDRDIVVSVVAMKLDPAVFTVGDMVMHDIATVREDMGVFETIKEMRSRGVRRMPVCDQDGRLVGIVSVDDLLQLVAEEMSVLAKLVSQQQAKEAKLKQ